MMAMKIIFLKPLGPLIPAKSIVLVGIRGTGKSTLAILAAATFRRRILDIDYSFRETTGHSTASFRELHGSKAYQAKYAEVLQCVLIENDTGHIIVCTAGSMETTVQNLLSNYSITHPVIHIVRDRRSISDYLGSYGEHKIGELLDFSGKILRACTNFEFFNISEAQWSIEDGEANELSGLRHGLPPPTLTLKRLERHFLKFLSLIIAKSSIPSLEPAYPLSRIGPERREFTYALSLRLSELASNLDIENLEYGADALEIIIDDVPDAAFPQANDPQSRVWHSKDIISELFASLRMKTIIPIIYHVQIDDCSKYSQHRARYLELILHGLRLAPEYMSIDLSLEDVEIHKILRVKGPTKLIGHYRDVSESPIPWSDRLWAERFSRGKHLGFDIIRLVRPALVLEDNWDVQTFRSSIVATHGKSVPLIAYNTGALGRTSSCFNPTLTSVIPSSGYNGLQGPHELSARYHQSLVTANAATEALFSSFVFQPMKLYLLGGNIHYSVSPAMHNAAFRAVGLPHQYRNHQVNNLSSIGSALSDPFFAGSSISLPFKVEIIALTHSLSRHARQIGAVNTLIPIRQLTPEGNLPDEAYMYQSHCRSGPVVALFGENTDWIGIRACIRRGLSPVNTVRQGTTGLIIGAGGFARAAIYGLLQMGVKDIFIWNRTLANAEKLVQHYGTTYNRDTPSASLGNEAAPRFHVLASLRDSWPDGYRQPTIVVSCIPTHAIGDSLSPDFTMPLQWLKSPTGGVVIEVAYKTLITPLLEQIRAESHRGWVAMDGLDVLPELGFAQFELFTGRRAPRRAMRLAVLSAYQEHASPSEASLIRAKLERIQGLEP